MSNLNVEQTQQLNLYLKKNPKVSREKAIQLLFGKKKNTSSVTGKGVTLEHNTQNAPKPQTIYLQSGRKVVYTRLKDGRLACKYYGADGTAIKPDYFKKVEGNISISTDNTSYTLTKKGKRSKAIKAKNPRLGVLDQNIVKLNNEEKRLNKIKNQQGFIGNGWDWIKNKTGLGDGSDKAQKQLDSERQMLTQMRNPNAKIDASQFEKITGQKCTKANLEKFKQGELSQTSAKINGYQEGQEMAVDIVADTVSGIAAIPVYGAAVAAAPFTGGTSIAIGIAAAGATGALLKVGIKAADAASGGRQYTLNDAGHDAATGTFSGILAPVTGGLGGAIGKTVATKVGLQTVKTVGKEIAEDVVESGFKQTLKTSLINPGAYKYVGEGVGKKALAYGSEILADGAVNGGIDNGFRTAINGGSLSDVVESAGEGALFAPLVGLGIKGSGYAFGKIPFNKIPETAPQVVILKKSPHNLYPESDAAELTLMKENLLKRAKGTEKIELMGITEHSFPDNEYVVLKETQSGSNPGFWAEHKSSGNLYYMKTANGQQNITEHISSQLYRAAGIDTPEMNLIEGPGFKFGVSSNNCWIKSKAITGLKPLEQNPKAAYEGFAVDAWLANWDAVCSGNTLLKNGNAVRVDFGGTLNFRARGAKKQFGNEVPELSTLLNPKINPESAKVFKNMTRENLISSLERVQSVTDNDIQKIYSSVKTYINPEIFESIKNRKTYLNYILYEAKNIKMKPCQNIMEYVKTLEDTVQKKYEKQLKHTNAITEQRTRILKEMKSQRDNICTKDDIKALWEYKLNNNINNFIQQGSSNLPIHISLDKALDKTSLSEPTILYRGDHIVTDGHTNFRYRKDIKDIDLQYKFGSYNETIENKATGEVISLEDLLKKIFKKGKIVTEEQFVSTTVNESVAREFSSAPNTIIYRYHAPEGTKATTLEHLNLEGIDDSNFYGDLSGACEGSETEILLKRGFKYRMDKLSEENGKYIIDCTILKDNKQ